MLAWFALTLHCIVFAAFDFIDDEGATGRILFPLAPLALIIGMFCIAASYIQLILLLIHFAKRSGDCRHRLTAIILTWVAISLIFVAGRFGWFIHV